MKCNDFKLEATTFKLPIAKQTGGCGESYCKNKKRLSSAKRKRRC